MSFLIYCTMFIILSAASLLPCTLLLISIIWQRKTCLRSNLDFQTLGLLVAQLAYNMGVLTVHITNYTSGHFTSFNCTFSAIMLMCIVGTIVSIHMTIALDRYFILVATSASVKFKTLIKRFLLLCNAAIIATEIIWCLKNDGFVPIESGVWCWVNLVGEGTLGTWLLFIFIFGATLLIGFCYLSIFFKVREIKRSDAKIIKLDDKVKIANKFLFIFLVFAFTYSPTFLTFLYRFAFKTNIHVNVEYVCSAFVVLEPTFTTFLLLYLNRNYRAGFKRLVSARFSENPSV